MKFTKFRRNFSYDDIEAILHDVFGSERELVINTRLETVMNAYKNIDRYDYQPYFAKIMKDMCKQNEKCDLVSLSRLCLQLEKYLYIDYTFYEIYLDVPRTRNGFRPLELDDFGF